VLPRLSVVIPVYNEGESVTPTLDATFAALPEDAEVLVVYDMAEDTTIPVLERYATAEPRLRPLHNTLGPGPANAIRYGLDQAQADVAVVTMADSSDDPAQIAELAQLVDDGAVIGAASRYMKGGRQIGGPLVKRTLSRLAGQSLYLLGRVGTHDATNSFKAYSTHFVRRVGVESDQGFEIGIELVAKARRARLPVAEIPTTWRDRSEGESRFKVAAWIPHYLRWYAYAFGPAQKINDATPNQVGEPT
jgi:glycosyltransferase involved in cell wall biosynthesis